MAAPQLPALLLSCLYLRYSNKRVVVVDHIPADRLGRRGSTRPAESSRQCRPFGSFAQLVLMAVVVVVVLVVVVDVASVV